MATQTTIILTDSLDERIKTGVETVTFFDPMTGKKREIELGEANRKHFANHLEKLAKYVAASVVVEVAVPVKATASKNETTKIREWAKANGFTIGDRGRIKAEIMDAYFAAQNAFCGTAEPKVEQKDDEHDSELAKAFLATNPEELAQSFTDGIVDADDLVEVEFPQVEPSDEELSEAATAEPLDDAAILAMMEEIAGEGKTPELSDLEAKVSN